MADIPENPASGAPSHVHTPARMDPRSGMVSPQAWRMRTNESNTHPPQIQDPNAFRESMEMSIVPETHRPVGRSQTVDFETRRWE